jgi:hypothetical protein
MSQQEKEKGGGNGGDKEKHGVILFYNACQDVKSTAIAQNTFQQQLLMIMMEGRKEGRSSTKL